MKTKSAVVNWEFVVLERHLDTFGHVNNARYLEIYEDARWDLITKNNYGLKEVLRTKIGPIILGVDLQFKNELKLRETITVTSQCLDYGGKIYKIEQKMLKASGEEASTALFTCGLFDLEKRKLIDMTPEWTRAVGME